MFWRQLGEKQQEFVRREALQQKALQDHMRERAHEEMLKAQKRAEEARDAAEQRLNQATPPVKDLIFNPQTGVYE